MLRQTRSCPCPLCHSRAPALLSFLGETDEIGGLQNRDCLVRSAVGVLADPPSSDETHPGEEQKFLTVVCNLDTAETVWFGRERKKETLDELFKGELSTRQRRGIEAACVDMWEPYRLSIEQWAPNCRIVYDKCHVMQHANQAVDEVRRAEFFRKGGRMRGVVKGKRWLLLTRWVNLTAGKRQELNRLFALNRKVFKAYMLKEVWTGCGRTTMRVRC